LANLLNYSANNNIACVGQKASEEARGLRQDLLKMSVHLFELEFHPGLVFRDLKKEAAH